MAVGDENLRNLVGDAVAGNAKGQTVEVLIHDIYRQARGLGTRRIAPCAH